jgi:hypothetical protein
MEKSALVCFLRNARIRSAKKSKQTKTKLANCETVKLWTQAADFKGSTVSQFHSLTKRHGGWGRGNYGGVGKKQGTRDQGNKGTRSRKAGNGEAGVGVGYRDGGVGAGGRGVGKKQWLVGSGKWLVNGARGAEKQGTREMRTRTPALLVHRRLTQDERHKQVPRLRPPRRALRLG